MTVQSTSNITKELNEELQLCKEKISSLEKENCQLNLQGSKVGNKALDVDTQLNFGNFLESKQL